MKTISLEKEKLKPELGLLFVLLVGMSVSVTAFLPAAFFDFWRMLVIGTAVRIGGLWGLAVNSHADILTVNGFAMQVINECTALNYVIILSTAMLLFARHSIRYRLVGVLIAVPTIILVNAFRLVISGICGSVSRRLFDIVHEYLWVALFALLIFAMWKVWADRSLPFSRKKMQQTAAVLVSCSAMFSLLIVAMPVYAPFLAWLSSLILEVFLGDSQTAIAWVGNNLQCNHAGTIYRVPFALEYFNIAVFAGLVLPLQRRGDWKTLASSLVALISALLLNAMLIANSIYLMIRHGQGVLQGFLLIEKGVLLAVPFALWWIVSSDGERGQSLKSRKDAPTEGRI